MSLTHRALILGVGCGLIGALGVAESARANELDVTASVAEACSVNPGTLTFGEYTPGSPSALEGGGSFSVDCTPSSTSVNILLDGGDHQNGSGTRRMANAGETGFLEYNIVQPNEFGEFWGDDGLTIVDPSYQAVLDSGTTTINFIGSILGSQSPPSGDYSDLVLISLAYN